MYPLCHRNQERRSRLDPLQALIALIQRDARDDVRGLVESNPKLVQLRDDSGATALHHATLGGHRAIAQILVAHGADINARDTEFGATPAGWAIEYLREMGGFLGIELDDFNFAIERRDIAWVERSLQRFPALRTARNGDGIPFSDVVHLSGNTDLIRLFERRATSR